MEENTQNFTGPDGEFVPSEPRTEGTLSIGYLTELCEWIYYHNVYTDEEKMEHILSMEKIIVNLLHKIMPGCGYRPTWSKKQEDKMKKT